MEYRRLILKNFRISGWCLLKYCSIIFFISYLVTGWWISHLLIKKKVLMRQKTEILHHSFTHISWILRSNLLQLSTFFKKIKIGLTLYSLFFSKCFIHLYSPVSLLKLTFYLLLSRMIKELAHQYYFYGERYKGLK